MDCKDSLSLWGLTTLGKFLGILRCTFAEVGERHIDQIPGPKGKLGNNYRVRIFHYHSKKLPKGHWRGHSIFLWKANKEVEDHECSVLDW